MTDHILDATVLIDHLRGHPDATGFLAGLQRPPLCSELTRVEVGRGLRAGERRAADQLFAALSWVPVTSEIARLAVTFGRKFRRSHRIDLADLVVAATARHFDGLVATTNVKHFPMFAGLTAPYG